MTTMNVTDNKTDATTALPTRMQIELIRSDLLLGHRDEQTFTYKDVRGAINRTIGADKSYSSFLGSASGVTDNTPDALRRAREIAATSKMLLSIWTQFSESMIIQKLFSHLIVNRRSAIFRL